MGPRIVGSAILFASVLVLGSVLLGRGAAEAQPAAPQATAENPPDASTSDGETMNIVTFGVNGPACAPGDWEPLPGGSKNQTVTIDIAKSPPKVKMPKPPCAKESYKGAMTFQLTGSLPTGYSVEIDILTGLDPNKKNPRKGPFKRNTKGDEKKYPVTGRCWLTTSTDSCTFDSHDSGVKTNREFRYTVTLFDAKNNYVHEIDPGIMVTDNP